MPRAEVSGVEVVRLSMSFNDLRIILDDFFEDPRRTAKHGLAHLADMLGREPREMEALLVRHLHKKTARDRGGNER